MLRTCNYGNCLAECGKDGMVVALHSCHLRATFCCAAHAAAALARLAQERCEPVAELPRLWRTS